MAAAHPYRSIMAFGCGVSRPPRQTRHPTVWRLLPWTMLMTHRSAAPATRYSPSAKRSPVNVDPNFESSLRSVSPNTLTRFTNTPISPRRKR